jgi:glycosyltransferase involved in cell wall biosynthesis
MRIVQLTTDAREHYGDYGNPNPCFGAAPEALLQGFAALPGVEIHVVACTRRKMCSPSKLAENVWYHSLLVPKLGWMRTFYLGCVRAVRTKLKAIQPDIVHGQGTERDCGVCAVLSGFPNVLTLHGNMAEIAKVLRARPGSYYWFAAAFENFVLRRTRGVFCNSNHTEASVKPRTRCVWRVPNAVRSEIFVRPPSRVEPSPGVILVVGVISVYKRQLEILELAGELHRRGLRVAFRFVGQASKTDAYARGFLTRIQRAEQEGYASYAGFKSLDALIEEYDRAAALVHAPSAESFGLVVAEALGRNLKLFGMRVGGVPDIALGVDGAELFPDGDWEGLKASIARWIHAGCPRPQIAGRVMRQRYHPGVIARRHVEIYREVFSTRS